MICQLLESSQTLAALVRKECSEYGSGSIQPLTPSKINLPYGTHESITPSPSSCPCDRLLFEGEGSPQRAQQILARRIACLVLVDGFVLVHWFRCLTKWWLHSLPYIVSGSSYCARPEIVSRASHLLRLQDFTFVSCQCILGALSVLSPDIGMVAFGVWRRGLYKRAAEITALTGVANRNTTEWA